MTKRYHAELDRKFLVNISLTFIFHLRLVSDKYGRYINSFNTSNLVYETFIELTANNE